MVLKMSFPRKLLAKRERLKWYLTGFTDAEGCFSISLKRQETARFGWVLDPVFHVTQHKSNRKILEVYKNTLKCGRLIEKPGQKDTYQYIVENRRQLAEKVIPYFEKLAVKESDYKIFSEIVTALENKDHSDLNKFKKLVKKAFMMNQEGKQRRRSLKEVLSDLDKQDPQRPYVGHNKK